MVSGNQCKAFHVLFQASLGCVKLEKMKFELYFVVGNNIIRKESNGVFGR